ncbi:beta-1,6-N-acetylglucosaminyltransferase [Viscerimonas tarda]
MQQAILITAYKNSGHLNKIVDFFSNSPSGFYCFIHIDKKSAIPKDEIEKLRRKDNVKLVSQKYSVNWGGINHLKAILLLLEAALKNSDAKYFHLITGHDFPVQSTAQFEAFREENEGKEFLEFNPFPYKNWENGGLDRISLFNIYDLIDGRTGWGEKIAKGIIKLQKRLKIKRGFPNDFPPLFGGSTYWSLSRNCIGYIFDYLRAHPRFLKRFNYSFCSEEVFFQTIIMNSPLKEHVVNNNLRFIVWEKRNGNFPANLDESDYNDIIKSNALFARKFEYPVSESLVSRIENEFKV